MSIILFWSRAIFVLIFSLYGPETWGQEESAVADIRIEGRLIEKGTRKPMGEVNIFLLPQKIKVTTDSQGNFTVFPAPKEPFKWIVNQSGYERLTRDDQIVETEAIVNRTLYLEKSSYITFETNIYGKKKKRDDTTRVLKKEEFETLPGSGGDPIKAIQNLPGIARQAGFQSRVVIQGAEPVDTRYNIDGHEVPLIFHFGGLNSVVFSEAVDRVEYLSAGYGPEMGRAMGGIVGVYTRPPRFDRWHGLAYLDLLNAGALIEGQFSDKSGFLISGRRSYIGEVFGLIAEGDEDFDLTVAPSYWDTSIIYAHELTPRDFMKVTFVGSFDKLEFVTQNPVNADNELRGNFNNRTAFFRLIPQFEHKHSEVSTTRWSLGAGKNWIRIDAGDNFFRLNTTNLSVRGEWERDWEPWWKTYLGFDNDYTYALVQLEIPSIFFGGGVASSFSTGDPRVADVERKLTSTGIYLRNEFTPIGTGWVLSPGVRFNFFTPTNEFLAAPRGAIKYNIDDYSHIRLAGGRYYQPPEPQQSDSTIGNPDLISPSVWQLALGGEHDFRQGSSRGLILNSGVFYRFFDDLVDQSTEFIDVNGESVPERFNNEERGVSYGFEALTKLRLAPWSGLFSYTLSFSQRWSPSSGINLSSADQTHNLNLIGAVDLPSNWKISARFRYVTGNPRTPIVSGVYDADNDVFLPVRGPFFSERISDFYQLDLRFDKKWIFEDWILSFYLDIQNVTNRLNVEAVRNSYDFGQETEVTGLPILPTIGLKGEF